MQSILVAPSARSGVVQLPWGRTVLGFPSLVGCPLSVVRRQLSVGFVVPLSVVVSGGVRKSVIDEHCRGICHPFHLSVSGTLLNRSVVVPFS